MKSNKRKIWMQYILIVYIICFGCLSMTACGSAENPDRGSAGQSETGQTYTASSLADIPEYTKEPYVVIDGNEPDFSEEDITTESFETYSELDELGRCQTAYANIGQDLMPTEERGSIGQVKPTGWQTVKYDLVDGRYLYNRCHLIGYQLTAENANEKNLITGTRYMNVEGMLPFENMVADYVKETGNHVLYRVDPVFEGGNLLAKGVQMEAWSVEDEGEGICFNVFVYNVQPGIDIDYATGASSQEALPLWIRSKSREEQRSGGIPTLRSTIVPGRQITKRWRIPGTLSSSAQSRRRRKRDIVKRSVKVSVMMLEECI